MNNIIINFHGIVFPSSIMHFVYATIMLNWNVTDNTKTLTCRMKRKHYKVEGYLTSEMMEIKMVKNA